MSATRHDQFLKAINDNNVEAVRQWLLDGVDLTRETDHLTPIQLAASFSHWECVEAMAKHAKQANVDVIKAKLGDPVLRAASCNQGQVVKVLLEAGAQTNWRDTKSGNYSLHYAVSHQNKEMLEDLLAHQADPEIKNKKGQTPLDLAFEGNYWDGVVALLNKLPLSYLKHTAEVIYTSLQENKFSAQDISRQITFLEMLDNAILGNILTELTAKLVDQDQASNPEQTAIHNEVAALKLALQTRLNYSTDLLSLKDLEQMTLPEAKQVAEIIKRKQGIDDYYQQVIRWLKALQATIQKKPWHVKALGYWSYSRVHLPENVQRIMQTLAKINDLVEWRDALKIYEEVRQILKGIQPSENRHKETTIFYRDTSASLEAVTFASQEKLAGKISELLPKKEPIVLAPQKEEAGCFVSTTALLYPRLEVAPSAPSLPAFPQYIPVAQVEQLVQSAVMQTVDRLIQAGSVMSIYRPAKYEAAPPQATNPLMATELNTAMFPAIPSLPIPPLAQWGMYGDPSIRPNAPPPYQAAQAEQKRTMQPAT